MQNIAKQKQSTDDPLITKEDFGQAFALASLTLFPGNTFFVNKNECFALGYQANVIWHCIKGTGSNICQQKWIFSVFNSNANCYIHGNAATSSTMIPYNTSTTSASSIRPGFSISNGEMKIIVEFLLQYDHAGRWGKIFANGTRTSDVSISKAFGYLIAVSQKNAKDETSFFPAFVIFTPIADSFSETSVPQ